LASLTVFEVASYLAFAQVVAHQNRKHIEELNPQALRRSEMAIDYAFTALSELVEQRIGGATKQRWPNCAARSINTARSRIFTLSTRQGM
jgi:hypothetical protein